MASWQNELNWSGPGWRWSESRLLLRSACHQWEWWWQHHLGALSEWLRWLSHGNCPQLIPSSLQCWCILRATVTLPDVFVCTCLAKALFVCRLAGRILLSDSWLDNHQMAAATKHWWHMKSLGTSSLRSSGCRPLPGEAYRLKNIFLLWNKI